MPDSHSKTLILWFRKDLRLCDHAALATAATEGFRILPVYIREPEEAGTGPLGAAQAWAAQVAALPPHLFPMTKTLLRQAASMTFEQALAMEEFAEPLCFTTGAHQSAVARFLDNGFGRA